MIKALFLYFFISIAFFAFSQKSILKNMPDGDTLNIKVAKFACRYGFDSDFKFSIIKTENKIEIRTKEKGNWKSLSEHQFKEMIKIEKQAIKKGCTSTNIATLSIGRDNKFKSYNTCWRNADQLIVIVRIE